LPTHNTLSVESLRSYRTLAQAASSATASQPAEEAAASTTKNGAPAASSSSSSVPAVEVTEYFKPSSDTVKELLSHVKHERCVSFVASLFSVLQVLTSSSLFFRPHRPLNDLYTMSLFTSLLRQFTSHFSLAHPRSPKLLLLAPSSHPQPSSLTLEQESAMELLSKLVIGSKKENLRAAAEEHGKDRGSAGCTTREEVLDKIKAGCTGYWGLKSGKEDEVVKCV
jgi:hypothetical protein